MERQQFLREAVPLEAPRGIRDGETQQQCYSTPRVLAVVPTSPEQQHVARPGFLFTAHFIITQYFN